MSNHPKEDATLHIRRLSGAPNEHYLREWAKMWEALEKDYRFYVLGVDFKPFAMDAGRLYTKFHILGLAGGVTQSAAEDEITRWVKRYATRFGMGYQIRARYLRPKPQQIGGLFVAQTVLQMEVVVCSLKPGQSLTPPKPPEGPTYRTWRSADYPERIAHAG